MLCNLCFGYLFNQIFLFLLFLYELDFKKIVAWQNMESIKINSKNLNENENSREKVFEEEAKSKEC